MRPMRSITVNHRSIIASVEIFRTYVSSVVNKIYRTFSITVDSLKQLQILLENHHLIDIFLLILCEKTLLKRTQI